MKTLIWIFVGVALLFAAADNSFAKKGADVNARDRAGQTALMRAASAGDPDTVKALLAAGAEVKVRDYTFQTALIKAAASGHADVVKLLLDAGAGKEAKKDGKALIPAAQSGYSDVVKLLLDAGVNKEAHIGIPSNFTAVWHSKLNSRGLNPGMTFTGASRGGLTITVIMTQPEPGGEIYVNCSGVVAQTPLTLAALNGHVDVVKLLLDAGANKFGWNELYVGQLTPSRFGLTHYSFYSGGETALEAAKQGNRQDVVDLLTARGVTQ